ncbi:MAG: OmpA family protein, partial [Bacteroidota bacterium]
VTDVDSKKPLPGAKVMLVGTDGSSIEVETDELGNYSFDENPKGGRFILENTSYTMTVSKEKFLNAKGQETTVGVEQSTAFVHDFALQPFTVEINLPLVLYDLGKWDLQVNETVNSKDSLQFLVQVMNDNPNIVIELAAHTDSRGSDKSNQILSQKRAQTCVDFLISQGISSDRMVAAGYGESRLKITDDSIAQLPSEEEREAAHQKNRRTVFSVLRDDYVPTQAPAPADGNGEAQPADGSGDTEGEGGGE